MSRTSLRTSFARVAILLTTSASACGGSTLSETGPQVDGGRGGHKDGATADTGKHDGGATRDTGGRSEPETGGTCNLVQIIQPILTVTDSATGKAICDATIVGADGGPISLYPCGAMDGCGGNECQYTVGGLDSSSAVSITVTAPSYSSASVSVMVEYCGCGPAPCAGAQQAMVSLIHDEGVDAGQVKDAGPSEDAGAGSACPPSFPPQNGPCSLEGLFCDYGTNANPKCNSLWECQSSHWVNMSDETSCPSGAFTCPSSYAAAGAHLTCGQAFEGALCDYPQGTCVCTSDPGGLPQGGAPSWYCTPTTAGCPAAPPSLGTACVADSGNDCDYGGCSGGVTISCTHGYWAIADTPCPL